MTHEPLTTGAGIAHDPLTSRTGMNHDPLPSNGTQHESRAAIGGHPIHPMLVPLPIGALTGALVTDLAYLATHDRFWARASRLLLGAGLLTGIAAAPFGVADLALVPHARTPVVGRLHGAGNLGVLALTAINFAARGGAGAGRVRASGVALSALGALLLGVTGWLGGELSYRHRIGVAAVDPDAGE